MGQRHALEDLNAAEPIACSPFEAGQKTSRRAAGGARRVKGLPNAVVLPRSDRDLRACWRAALDLIDVADAIRIVSGTVEARRHFACVAADRTNPVPPRDVTLNAISETSRDLAARCACQAVDVIARLPAKARHRVALVALRPACKVKGPPPVTAVAAVGAVGEWVLTTRHFACRRGQAARDTVLAREWRRR